jgi:hypothetical protein
LDSNGSGQGPVAGCCECGDEPSCSCATELVSSSFTLIINAVYKASLHKLRTVQDLMKVPVLFFRLKPWHSLTGVAGHHLHQHHHLLRHIEPQNRHPHPSGRRLQHRPSKSRLYTLLPKKATNSRNQTVVSKHCSLSCGVPQSISLNI